MFYLPYLPRAAYNIANNRKHYAGDNQVMNSLKEQRTRRGLSVRQLAAKANVDPSAVSLLENDHRKAQQTTLSKLAAALNVPPETFTDLLDTSAAERGRASPGQQETPTIASTRRATQPHAQAAPASPE